MLKGCETPGYVIVSASKTSILNCEHQPIWREGVLKDKTTWVGSVDCMQVTNSVITMSKFNIKQE